MRKISRFVLCSVSALMLPAPAAAQDAGLAAADYVCSIAKEKGKSRLAVFPFTDAKDQETAETAKETTRVMGAVLKCGLGVIDQSKVKHVLTEQSLGETGLVDSETAPEIGKLTGADSLMFASLDPKSMQLRVVDTTTGQIIGAGVIDMPAPTQAKPDPTGQKNPAVVKTIEAGEAQRSAEVMQIRQALRRLHTNKPRLFAYAVSTDREIADFRKKHPGRHKALTKAVHDLAPIHKRKMERLRTRVLQLRASDKGFDARVVEMRAGLKND